MKNLITVVGAALIGMLIAYFIWVRPQKAEYNNLTELLDSTRTEFATYRNEKGREIATQNQTITSLQNALHAGVVEKEELEDHNLKLLESVTRLESQIKMLETQIAFKEPVVIEVPAENGVDLDTYLRVPQSFEYSDTWTLITGEVLSEGINLQELSITTGETVYMGYQKQGFLKKSQPVVIVEYDNPYMETITMDNVQITTPRPFYRRPWWHRGEGAVLALILNFLIR